MKSDKGLIFVVSIWLMGFLLWASVVIGIMCTAFHFIHKYW